MEENLKQAPSQGVIRITVYGPARSGKSTLAKHLAEHFGASWVPDYRSVYLQKKSHAGQEVLNHEDLIAIAAGHVAQENDALSSANRFLFLDSNLMAVRVMSERQRGVCPVNLEKASRKHRYELFLLTDTQFGLENSGADKEYDAFHQALIDHEKPFVRLSGPLQSRIDHAVKLIEELELALSLGFSSFDFLQIKSRQLSVQDLAVQLGHFKKGIARANLDRPATTADGIASLSESDYDHYAAFFDSARHKMRIAKFVPASGAASRMFKFLSEFLRHFNPDDETLNSYINRKGAHNLSVFLAGMEKFPFYEHLMHEMQLRHPDFKTLPAQIRHYAAIHFMLSPDGWNFCNLPKGVLPFHKYDGRVVTAVEEHLNESVYYAIGKDQVCHLHFTVSESHQHLFEQVIARQKPLIESNSGTTIDVTYSYQAQSTDTLAVTPQNEPFRTSNGKLLFRPGGHGALLENLAAIDAEVIFIKNIDNVIQNHVHEIARYKKALAGLLLELRGQICDSLKLLTSGLASDQDVAGIATMAKSRLNIDLPHDFEKFALAHQVDTLIRLLRRPLRVCGMVRNEGEPGGGPFWVRDSSGRRSLQIVESTQVDLEVPAQRTVFEAATHFNPVDLVCCIFDEHGHKFDLREFVDPNSGFIAHKTKDGQPLKAYELPGLWNGSMANWITVFVEVPLMTFNPVKTVNDLLKPAHQPL